MSLRQMLLGGIASAEMVAAGLLADCSWPGTSFAAFACAVGTVIALIVFEVAQCPLSTPSRS